MTNAFNIRLSLTAMACAMALLATEAGAQQGIRGYGNTVLVAPDGAILDYMPEAGEVTVQYNRRGQRVLIDRYGNLLATEVHAGNYSGGASREARYDSRDRYGRRAYTDDRREYIPNDDYQGGFDASNPGRAVPRNGEITRLPLEEQPYPDDNLSTGSIDPQQDGFIPDNGAAMPQPQQPAVTNREDPPIQLKNKSRAEITALQVFLDREGSSPGVIDGKMGANVTKALKAWEQISGETLDPNDTEAVLERLRLSGGMPIISYTITSADAAGPYVAEIPEDYAHKAMLPHMSFTSTTEMLAERFHMDEAYLKELNPGVDFTIPGTTVKVVNPGTPKRASVARIVADKGRKQVLAYGEDGALVAAYPASIGSSDTPSPSGTVTVERVALDPGYTYNPKINFQQGGNDKILSIPPGPNGPVGTVWIALSKPTYGIHGTPEPSKIGRTQSHGCIRLTNWDATELAKMVKPGITVEFID